jgi:threonine synthase
MARQFLHEYNGKAISVTDNEILEASSLLSRRFGLFAEPAAAAAYAGYLNQNHESKISGKITSVVLLTGSGLKDTAAVKPLVKIPGSITPNLENLKKLLS